MALTSIPRRYQGEKALIIPFIMRDAINSLAPPEGASQGNVPALQIDRADPKVSYVCQVGGRD
jgi:hypothetical protein